MKSYPSLLLLLALTGCPSNNPTSTDDMASSTDGAATADMAGDMAVVVLPDMSKPLPTSFLEWKGEFVTTYCKYAFLCCSTTEKTQFMAFIGATEGECVANATARFDFLFGNCSDDVTAQRVSFDSVKANACLTGARTATCGGGLTGLMNNCSTVMTRPFASQQGVGSECAKCGLGMPVGSCKAARCDSMNTCAALNGPCPNGFTDCDPATQYCKVTNDTCTNFIVKDGDCSGGGQCDPANGQFCDGMKCKNNIAVNGSCQNAVCDPATGYPSDPMMGSGCVCKALLAGGVTCDPANTFQSCKNGCDMMTNKCIAGICSGQ